MTSQSLFDECTARHQGDGQEAEILQCISNNLQEGTSIVSDDLESLAKGLDIFFLIFSAALMFFMQAGFATLCAGCVRKKNVQNTLLKNLLDACGAGLAFWSFGFAFAYGGTTETGEPTTFIGNAHFFLIGFNDYARWLYNFAFAATAATIVAGTLAERCQMVAYLCYSAFLTGFVYPVIAHAVWSHNGIFAATKADPLWGSGMVDFAGSGVVHVTGGFTALIATKFLGARRGRFHDDKGNPLSAAKKIQGHSVSLQVLGTFILWFGWYGFNPGSILAISNEVNGTIAALSAVNTTLSAASGCMASLLATAILSRRRTGVLSFDISHALNGALSGLVGITAGCALVETWAAVLIGAFSGLIYLWASEKLISWKIDDAVDAIPVHLFNGVLGVISAGLLATPWHMESVYGRSNHVGWFYSWGRGSSDATLLGTNVVGLLFIFGLIFFIMTPFFFVLNYLGWFRANPLEEIIGLDSGYSGGMDLAPDVITPDHTKALNERMDVRNLTNDNEEEPEEEFEDNEDQETLEL